MGPQCRLSYLKSPPTTGCSHSLLTHLSRATLSWEQNPSLPVPFNLSTVPRQDPRRSHSSLWPLTPFLVSSPASSVAWSPVCHRQLLGHVSKTHGTSVSKSSFLRLLSQASLTACIRRLFHSSAPLVTVNPQARVCPSGHTIQHPAGCLTFLGDWH